MNDAEQEE